MIATSPTSALSAVITRIQASASFSPDHDTFIHKNFFSAPSRSPGFDPHSDEEAASLQWQPS